MTKKLIRIRSYSGGYGGSDQLSGKRNAGNRLHTTLRTLQFNKKRNQVVYWNTTPIRG